jgi:ABC-type Mn2+/Zn2+ transport system permease subunit
LWSLLQTGQMPERGLVPMMVLLGGIGHFVLIGACLAALFDRRIDDKKVWKIVAGGVAVLAYFVLIIVVSDPR